LADRALSDKALADRASADDWAAGRLVRRSTRGHFDEVIVDTPVGELRAYIEPSLALPEQVEVRAVEALVYEDGRLLDESAGSADGDRDPDGERVPPTAR
jgi:hypothetical protein